MVSSRVHSSDVYRLYLQAVMSRRIMTEEMARALWKACTNAVARADPTKDIEFVDGNNEWNGFLDKVKRLLDPIDLEFSRFKDEETGVIMYAITNTKPDEVAQLASDYNPTEIAFFKAVVEQIILAPKHAYSISSIAALRELSHLKGSSMTKAQAEATLTSFVARGWLVKSKRGRYSLGTRSLLELNTYLKNTYDETDILECVACMEFVTKGYMCPTAHCTAPLHRHCYDTYQRSRRNLCPKCQQDWSEGPTSLVPIGEDAVGEKEYDHPRRRRVVNGDGDGEEEEEEDGPTRTQTQSQSQSQTQGNSQRRTQKASSQVAKKSKSRKSGRARTNGGKSKKRAVTPDSPEEEDGIPDDMYADDTRDDHDDDDDAIDIDNLAEIREKPSARRR